MATAEELLNEALGEEGVEESKVLTIDLDTRVINIPASVKHLGVESDDDVLRLEFSMPRYYNDEVDLSLFDKQINYLNARGSGDVYRINDAVANDDAITFSWLVGRNAAMFKGAVSFNICFKNPDAANTSVILREFNTTVAKLNVLEGLETSEAVVQEYADILVEWEKKLFGTGDTVEQMIRNAGEQEKNDVEAKGEMVLASIPDDYETLFNQSSESLRTRANAIVQTIEGRVVGASDASGDHLRGLKVYGKSVQDGTPSPNAPVDIASAGDNGEIKVVISGEDLQTVHEIDILTPNGLPGIPVTSGGNYIDADGQQWICDEIDFERGVYVQRVLRRTISDFSGAAVTSPVNGHTEGYISAKTKMSPRYGLCDKFPYLLKGSVLRFANDAVLIYFTIPGTFTADEWKAQMNAISPTVYLLLDTLIETPLSESELNAFYNARSVYPVTNVSNNADAWMEVKYNTDTQLYFNNSRGASDEQVDASVRAYAGEMGLQVPSDEYIEEIAGAKAEAVAEAATAGVVKRVNGYGADTTGDVKLHFEDLYAIPEEFPPETHSHSYNDLSDKPVRGVDYMNEEDKQEMLEYVLANISNASGVGF